VTSTAQVGQHRSPSGSALLGLDGVEVLAARVGGGEWQLEVQTTVSVVGCVGCGVCCHAPTQWVTGLVDLERRRLLDLVADRTRRAVQGRSPSIHGEGTPVRWSPRLAMPLASTAGADGVQARELSRLARTVKAWEVEILAFHSTAGMS
jgi:hypothetical protein